MVNDIGVDVCLKFLKKGGDCFASVVCPLHLELGQNFVQRKQVKIIDDFDDKD